MMLRISIRESLGFTGDVDTHTLSCRQTLPNLVAGVLTISFPQHAPHHVSNVHENFQSCRVGVQAATMIYNNPRADLAVCVHT